MMNGQVRVHGASLVHLYHLLCHACRASVPGDVVEVGCNEGLTSIFLWKVLRFLGCINKKLWLYDSFDGMPEMSEKDRSRHPSPCPPGSLACCADDVRINFDMRTGGRGGALIIEGRFEETLPAKLPSEIAFAFVDCDWHNSTLHVLSALWPKIANGGVVVMDDYTVPALPGVKLAVDLFFAGRPERPMPLAGSEQAYVVKRPC